MQIWRIVMATLQTRIDDNLKTQSDALFKDMGLTTTEAIRLFLTQCINRGELPFTPTGKRPNTQTLEALNETGGNSYKDVQELSKLWK